MLFSIGLNSLKSLFLFIFYSLLSSLMVTQLKKFLIFEDLFIKYQKYYYLIYSIIFMVFASDFIYLKSLIKMQFLQKRQYHIGSIIYFTFTSIALFLGINYLLVVIYDYTYVPFEMRLIINSTTLFVLAITSILLFVNISLFELVTRISGNRVDYSEFHSASEMLIYQVKRSSGDEDTCKLKYLAQDVVLYLNRMKNCIVNNEAVERNTVNKDNISNLLKNAVPRLIEFFDKFNKKNMNNFGDLRSFLKRQSEILRIEKILKDYDDIRNLVHWR